MSTRQLGAKATRPTDLLSLQDSIITGAIAGLTTANDNTTPATVLDVAVGLCADSTGQYLMRLSSAWTKSIASNFAVGTGAGGLDTGAVATGWYHVHLIYNPTAVVSDILFSLSPTAPTLPTGYTAFRRIGSIYYTSSAIRPFSQNGNEFLWKVGASEYTSYATAANSTALLTAAVPTGIKVNALLAGNWSSATANASLAIASPDKTITIGPDSVVVIPAANNYVSFTAVNVRTNTTGQYQVYGNTAGTLTSGTSGWIDTFGITTGTVSFQSTVNNTTGFAGGINGLITSNDNTTPATVLDIAGGMAVDTTGAQLIQLPSAITKSIASTWAVGSNAGGLDTGSVATGWYHVFVIKNVATGVSDALFSLSPTAPTLPAGYTVFRRIASIYYTGGIKAYSQNGNEFLWRASTDDVEAVALAANTATLYTVSVPTGVRVNALVAGIFTSTTNNALLFITSPDQNAAGTRGSYSAITNSASTYYGQIKENTRTNLSGQVQAYCAVAATIYLGAAGWIDTRDSVVSSVSYRSVISNLVQFPGGVSGLTLSNDVTTPATVLDIAPGLAADTTNAVMISIPSMLAKSIASVWAAGTGNGGLDTGTVANGNWYHVFAISNAAGTLADVLFSLSAVSPTLPSGYTLFRRIGSIKYLASAIRPFLQIGTKFWWTTDVVYDVNGTSLVANTPTVLNLPSAPSGVVTTAILGGYGTSAAAGGALLITPRGVGPSSPFNGQMPGTANGFFGINIQVETDGASPATIRAEFYSGSSAGTVYIGVLAWIDTLGAPSAGNVIPAAVNTTTNSGQSFRNVLINGNFNVNQRAVSGTVTLAAGAYGHDRWKAGASGCTYTFATNAAGDTSITITAGSLLQIIEGALYIKTTTYTLSNAGTAQGRVYQGSTPNAYAACPIATSGLTQNTNTTVEFGIGTVNKAQLEAGTTASSFEYRDDDVRRCQRYFVQYQPKCSGVISSATTLGRLGAPLPVKMRAAPTLTMVGTVNYYTGNVAATISNIGASYCTPDAIEFDAGCASNTGQTAGMGCTTYFGGGGQLVLNAEL